MFGCFGVDLLVELVAQLLFYFSNSLQLDCQELINLVYVLNA